MASFRNTTNGSLAALNNAVTLGWRHFSNGGIGLQLTGTWSGSVKIEGTIDGSTWVALAYIDVSATSATAASTAITANGIYRAEAVGLLSVRAKATVWTSGTATVTLVALDN